MLDRNDCEFLWEDASAGDLKTLESVIFMLGRYQNKILPMIFHKSIPRLVAPRDQIIASTRCFSSGEQILVELALDLWERVGITPIFSVFHVLDLSTLKRVVKVFSLS